MPMPINPGWPGMIIPANEGGIPGNCAKIPVWQAMRECHCHFGREENSRIRIIQEETQLLIIINLHLIIMIKLLD